MSTLVLPRPARRTVLLDALLCACALAVPALSHAAALPLYRLDPMRLLLFAALLLTSRRNALAMALWLPLLSTLTSGHPVPPKMVLIQGELVLNAVVFHALWRRRGGFAGAAVVSVVVAKFGYYGAKYASIRLALMDGELVATSWVWQTAAVAIVLLAGGAVSRRGSRFSAPGTPRRNGSPVPPPPSSL
jgi:hypothetical protein